MNRIKNTTTTPTEIILKKRGALYIKWRPYLLLLPTVIVTFGILIPFFAAIGLSFTNYSFKSSAVDFVWFKNWIEMFKSAEFWNALWVTMRYAIFATCAQMLLGMCIALLLNKDTVYARILKIVFILPLMVAPAIATIIWQLLTNPTIGILQKFLSLFGVVNFPWASSSATALFTAVMIDSWVYTPFVILLMVAGLNSLPRAPYEAARIDGGSRWFTFRTLTLPMMKPFIFVALIFRLMASLQEFSIIFALTRGGPGDTLMSMSLTAYMRGFAYMDLGRAIPIILVLWVIIFLASKYLVALWAKGKKKSSSE